MPLFLHARKAHFGICNSASQFSASITGTARLRLSSRQRPPPGDERFGRAARATAARRRTPPSPDGCRRTFLGRRCGHLLSRCDANLAPLIERPAKRGQHVSLGGDGTVAPLTLVSVPFGG